MTKEDDQNRRGENQSAVNNLITSSVTINQDIK